MKDETRKPSYLSRYSDAANFFTLSDWDKELLIKKYAWLRLPSNIQKLFNKNIFFPGVTMNTKTAVAPKFQVALEQVNKLPDNWFGPANSNEKITYGATFDDAKAQVDEDLFVLKRTETSAEGYRVTWARRQN